MSASSAIARGEPTTSRWASLYAHHPLQDAPRQFAQIPDAPYLFEYLKTTLRLCPRGERTLETGIGTGHSAIWLSLRGCLAEGIDTDSHIVERARIVNGALGGTARFHVGDLFQLPATQERTYAVIHHQGVLEHFTAPEIRAALATQVALAKHVVFSVPSVHYPFDPEFGDERLLPIEEWERLLEPFGVEELRYYGDPALGGREHILGVLRGSRPPKVACAIPEPYLDGISAIVHTRNEVRHIGECLETLKGWTDELIVCDMESSDGTVEIARRYTDQIVLHPLIANFDRARNVSAMRAHHKWVFYLDADERVPEGLGPALRELIHTKGDTLDALLLPFRHVFAGRWMQCLYPGYTAPRLFRNGRFHFNPRPHSGAHVDGRIARFPADNPGLAIVHLSFDSISHYLSKLNRYTDSEAENMHRDGMPFHWQRAVRHFVQDLKAYYDALDAGKDGVHGFLYSFLSGFYRFAQHAKLFELRAQSGVLSDQEVSVPASAEDLLAYALEVARERPQPPAKEVLVAREPVASPAPSTAAAGPFSMLDTPARVLWSGPLYDPSGYGDECRNFLLGLDTLGIAVAGHAVRWSGNEALIAPQERPRLDGLCSRPVLPGFVQITQDFPTRFNRHPEAGASIGRTMFETDRLPDAWVEACNRMDYIWVPSEFNKCTFADAGVAPNKLVVIPGPLDGALFREAPIRPNGRASGSPFTFVSVFDWTLHKGWDVLLRAFADAFPGRDDVRLILKVWSTLGYPPDEIRAQASVDDPRVTFRFEQLTPGDLVGLYRTADALVLPSRGEGWGRPLMEAMACGLPVIGTNWSGNTAFMTSANSYLIDCDIVDVPERGWREIPTYKGHRWAEPDQEQLVRTLRQVVGEREEAAEVGARAREEVLSRFDRPVVARMIASELERVARAGTTAPIRADRLYGCACPDAETHVEATADRTTEDQEPSRNRPSSEPRGTVAVRWEGALFSWHSLAHVNREFCLGLMDSGRVEVSLVPTEPQWFDPTSHPRFAGLPERVLAPLTHAADVHVRHHFPPRLSPAPDEGRFVLIQPWEYGYLPEEWIEPMRRSVHEVWCYSRYVKQVYVDSGIEEASLHVVPLGIDPRVFRPDALPHVFTDEPGSDRLARLGGERFLFLYVGGTLERKGIDILLDAFVRAFSLYDDVCLVIKDTGTDTVYRGQNARERILALSGDRSRPPIVYLDTDLPPSRLAGLFAACDCFVAPYRGEGFCLPALEAMACGTPVVVTGGGPTDDFVDETVGWRLPAERRPFGDGRIGEWTCVKQPNMLNVNVDDLARALRAVRASPDEARRRGQAAAQRAQSGWTWARASDAALARLEALAGTSLTKPNTGRRRAPEAPSARSGARRGMRRRPAQPSGALRPEPTVSLCMIVRNEERCLAAALESAKPWVDEMVVVDTGSEDRTIEIARAYEARVHEQTWGDDFSAARNVSLQHARCDWVFWMDADDTLPEDCGRRMREALRIAEERTTAFIMQVHIPHAPGEYGTTVVDHVKLFRNLPDLRFEGRIHEQILDAVYRAGGRIERTDMYVVHSGYDQTPDGLARKLERDLRIISNDIADRPRHPFPRFNLGMTLFHAKDYGGAVEALEQCLALSQPRESTLRKVYALLVGSHLGMRDLVKARDWLETGLKLYPRDPELLFRAGALMRELGDLAASERYYLRLLTEREHGHLDSLDVSIVGYKARHNLALVYMDMGRTTDAEAQWRGAIEECPGFVPAVVGMADLCLRSGRAGAARPLIDRLVELGAPEAMALRERLGDVPA